MRSFSPVGTTQERRLRKRLDAGSVHMRSEDSKAPPQGWALPMGGVQLSTGSSRQSMQMQSTEPLIGSARWATQDSPPSRIPQVA